MTYEDLWAQAGKLSKQFSPPLSRPFEASSQLIGVLQRIPSQVGGRQAGQLS